MFPSEWQGSDYYATLGIEKNATLDEIKAEYRWLAKKFHPDFNPNDSKAHAKFLKIQQAYETLSDENKRNDYDVFLATKHNSSATVDDHPSPKNQPSKNEPSVTPDVQDNGWRVWAGIVAAVFVLFIALTLGGVLSSNANAPQASTPSDTRSTPPPPTVVPSRYTAEDIQACQTYLDWRVDFGGAGSPTTNEGLRSALNRMELDISSSFYLADDYELVQLSNAAKRAAGFAAAMVGTSDEAIWAMATTGFDDALGRLSAVCGTVR